MSLRVLLICACAPMLLVACSDSGGGVVVDAAVDAEAVDANSGPCQLVPQSGCGVEEKCSVNLENSVEDVLTPNTCVPEGNKPVGEDCAWGNPGPDTGYDNCLAWSLCVDGTCHELCATDLELSCSSGQTCETLADVEGITWPTTMPNIGVCVPN